MVGLLVQLKLSLLRNTLRRSASQAVLSLLAAALGLGVLGFGTVGLIGGRAAPVDVVGPLVVLAGAGLVLGWMVVPLLGAGVDETLDPRRFALLPVSARELLPGLLASSTVGVPGVVTACLALATVVTWSRDPFTAVVALVGAVLGVLTCLLCARTVTAAFTELLGSRRFKEVTSVLIALAAMSAGISVNALTSVVVTVEGDVLARLQDLAGVVGWTPFGWPWSAAAEAAAQDRYLALAKLALATGLVLALVVAWERLLSRRLSSPPMHGGGPKRTRERASYLEHVLPTSPTGAVALRSLRYLRRDPRYIASFGGILILPVAMALAPLATTGVSPWLVWVPVALAWGIGVATCQDTSYDGSAFWMHVTSGITGAEDRAGRALSQLVWGAPLTLAAIVGLAALTGAWAQLPAVLGLSVSALLSGLGVAAWVSATWQGPVAPPGANPFSAGSGSSAASFVAVMVASLLILVATAPVIVLAALTLWQGWLGWVALVVGTVLGLVVLRFGVRSGGRHLDDRWPEVLQETSKPAR